MSATPMVDLRDAKCRWCHNGFEAADSNDPFEQNHVAVVLYPLPVRRYEAIDEQGNSYDSICGDMNWSIETVYHMDCFDEMRQATLTVYRDHLLNQVRKYKGFSQDEITEYRDEAEHQDGYEYWTQFRNWKELATDIRGYIQISNESKSEEKQP